MIRPMGRRRRRAVAALAALLTAGALAGPAARAATGAGPAGGPGFAVGITPGTSVISETPARVASTMAAMAAAGDRSVRIDVPWPTVEARPGVFSWGAEDTAVRQAAAHGLKVDALVDYAPSWALTGYQPDPAKYASFISTVVKRYAPLGVHTYEIWNEENLVNYWDAPVNAPAYGRLLRAAYQAVHAADRHGFVVLGGMARTSGSLAGVDQAPYSFLSTLYAGGFGGDFDAVAVHPYSYPVSPTSASADNGLNALPAIHALMAAHGDGAKRIWVTEYGYSTGSQVLSGLVMPISEGQQASYLAAAIKRVQAEPWAGPFFVFAWQDDLWQTYGLLRADGSAKPALAVFRHAPH